MLLSVSSTEAGQVVLTTYAPPVLTYRCAGQDAEHVPDGPGMDVEMIG